ncbi:MAG: hypothetical protein JWQ02_2345 [Capsulimonas sp.]|jgi:hypothetical protein|nr:hypothetical protein [Capsulimonas sp.]
MTEEIPTPSDQEPSVSEEATAQTDPAAPLNREQRRALARGKKPSAGAKPGLSQGGAAERATGRGAAPAGGALFPRTGHK